MARRIRWRPPPAAGESGQAKQRFTLALALTALTLGLLLTSVTVYAIFTDSDSVTPNDFASDTLDPSTSLTATGGSSVNLSWTATVDTYASGHRVLRGTATGGPYTQIAQVTPRTTTTYTDSPADGTYYYVVRSFHQNWESANGNEASATVSGSGPTTVCQDTFTETSDTNLNLHTPDTGTGWTIEENTAPGTATVFGATDTLGYDPGDVGIVIATCQPSPSVAEYDVKITLTVISGGDDRPVFLIARFTDTNNYYSAGSRGASGPFEMWKRVAGVDTQLGTFAATPLAGDVIKFEVKDGTKKLFVNGVERISSTDNSLTSAGKAGLGLGDAWPHGNESDIDDSWRMDDFEVTE